MLPRLSGSADSNRYSRSWGRPPRRHVRQMSMRPRVTSQASITRAVDRCHWRRLCATRAEARLPSQTLEWRAKMRQAQR